MEAELCSGSSSLVNKKRKRKTKSERRRDKENLFPEKKSSMNMIISLPLPADSSSALENSKAQPCDELNPLPAKRKKKEKKKKRKIQETSTSQGDTGPEVPYSVLQANEPEVIDNITCSSANFCRSLEHEKIQPTGETYCLTMKQRTEKEKRKLRKRKKKAKKAKAKVSGNGDTLTEIRNNSPQVAELDENSLKEFSLTCSKQSDIEKNLCSSEKEDLHGEAHNLLSDFSNMSTSSKKERLKTEWGTKPASRSTLGTVDFSEVLVHKDTSFHSAEAHISHLSDSKPEQVEERIQVTLAQASVGTSKAEASVHDPEQRLNLPEKPETSKLHSAKDGSTEGSS